MHSARDLRNSRTTPTLFFPSRDNSLYLPNVLALLTVPFTILIMTPF